MIRPRRDSDIDRCVALLEDVHRQDGYPPAPFLRKPVDFLVSAAERSAWVAELDGRLVGHIALHDAAGDELTSVAVDGTGREPESLAVIARLFVAPTARRHGVGRELLATAAEHAEAQGRLPILDVGKTLTPAVAFYDSSGWRRIGDLTIDVGTGVISAWVYMAPSTVAPK